MNCDAIVVRGQLAWLPQEAASDLDPLHIHDVPLIGTFELHGQRILFDCLTGATSRINIWAYVPLEAEALTKSDDADFADTAELESWAHDQFVGRDAAFAVARDFEIKHWSVDRVGDDGVLPTAIRFMEMVLAKTQGRSAPTARQKRRAEQARADATRQVLEHA